MPSLPSPLVLSGTAAADAAALVALRPDPAALLRHLAAPHAWVAADGPDAVAVSLSSAALWVVACWLGAGLLALAATLCPGAGGRLAHLAARALLPRALYRLAAGATGLGVLLAPVAAGATTAGPTVPTPAWPSGATVPTPSTPLSPTPPGSRTADSPPGQRATDTDLVTVRPGDSLWRITAARLGARPSASRIAAGWPRWYAANRRLIGPDPGLIRPGQVLHAPADPTGTDR
jgi:nucleoid-associated protein YgaU